jgi:hypothetical protein
MQNATSRPPKQLKSSTEILPQEPSLEMSSVKKSEKLELDFGSARLDIVQSDAKRGDLEDHPGYSDRRMSATHHTGRRGSIDDAVFGEISESGPNYRDVRLCHRCFRYLE